MLDDGDKEGIVEGRADIDGWDEGRLVGVMDNVGLCDELGLSEIVMVGTSDIDGRLVGLNDGFSDAVSVGFAVGVAVGPVNSTAWYTSTLPS